MLIARLIRQLKLIVEDLGVINAEATLPSTHAYHLVNKVQLVFSYDGLLVLVDDNLRPRLVLGIVVVDEGSLAGLLLNQARLGNHSIFLGDAEHVLRKYRMTSAEVRFIL